MKHIIRYFLIWLSFFVFLQGTLATSYIWASRPFTVFQSLWVELKEKIATTYYAWDGLLIQGRVTNSREYAFLYLQNINTKKETTQLVRTDIYGNFRIPINLPKIEWKYYIIIASGNSFGASTPEIITLIPRNTPKNVDSPSLFISPYIVYDDLPYLNIGSDKWANMQIDQLGKRYTTSWKILMLNDFPLTFGRARITINWYGLSSSSPLDQIASLGFNWSGYIYIDRTREKIWENLVVLRVQQSLGTMQFRLKSWEQVLPNYYLTSPSGNVTKYTFPSSVVDTNWFLRTNILIRQNFPMLESGVYKIEAVRSNGVAYFNLPISKNQFWSIIDPMTDIQKRTLRDNSTVIDTSITNRINNMRKSLGLSPLTLDQKLSNIAQQKAVDMATYNYIWHITHQGFGIIDFARSLGIDVSGFIWENVAGWNISDISLQDWLEESGSHRYNMINPKWKHIGLGYILKDKKTYLCQIFSE